MKRKFFLLSMALLCVATACQQQDGTSSNPNQQGIEAKIAEIINGIATTDFPNRTLYIYANEDTTFDMRPELQKQIDCCSRMGGGQVCMHEGIYFIAGPLFLKSNVDLHLNEGARLKFSGNPQDYESEVLSRWEGTELYGRPAMIYAYMQHNIGITGPGIIDGQGSREMARWGMETGLDSESYTEKVHGTHGKTPETDDSQSLRQMGDDGVNVHDRIFAKGHRLRPACIELVGCSRVLIADACLRDCSFWCIHPICCDNVIVRRVTIDSHAPNNDGCDPESSSNVLIEECTFRTGDDAVAIKAGRDADGRRLGIPCERIVIRDCDFDSQCNGLCIGSEMSGGVQHVYMTDVRIGHVKNALLFKSNLDRGGYIRDVMVDSISIASAQGAVLRFETNYFGYRGGKYPAQYEDFTISRVYADSSAAYAIYYDGNPQCPIRRISVSDLHVGSAPHPYYLYQTEDCSFTRCTVGNETLPEHPKQSEERQSCDVW